MSSRPTAMRGKAISSGEKKIILNVFKHFIPENSSLIENAVIILTFKVPRIVKHGVKLPSKLQPNRKKEFNKLDEFNLGVVWHIIHKFYARGGSLANIYFFKAEISQICKTCVEHVKHEEKSYWKTDRTIDTKLDKLQIALKVKGNKDDNSEYRYSTEE